MPISPSPSPPPPPASARFAFTTGSFDYLQATTALPLALPQPGLRTRTTGPSRLESLSRGEREGRSAAAAAAEENGGDAPPGPGGPLITRARRRGLLREARRTIPPHAERSLLRDRDSPYFNPFAASGSSRRERSPTSDTDGPRRQSKRRKLTHDQGRTSEYDGFTYGYRGQVVAGRLRMTIESCDGGEHDRHRPERLYKPSNILTNDKSVYCSEDSQCNLLLKHHGATPFCLEKIVIRAPDRGFTAPVQEGLVFVSMSAKDLAANTASYRIAYATRSPTASPSPSPSNDRHLTLREAIEDPQLWEQSRRVIEEQIERIQLRTDQLRTELNPLMERQRRRRARTTTNDADDAPPDNCPYHVEETGEPTAAGVAAPTPPPFTITTEDDQEESDDNTTMPSPAIMADRLRRESRWRSDSDEEDGDDSRMPLLHRARALHLNVIRRGGQLSVDHIRATRLRAPSHIEPNEDEINAEDMMEPQARFFIARHKSKITIKFHPSISGKYLLLKLWSPKHDGNIDIESVQCYGFSGPRFFPAIQPC